MMYPYRNPSPQQLRRVHPYRLQVVYEDGTTTLDTTATLDDVVQVIEHIERTGTDLTFYPTFAIVGPTGNVNPISRASFFSIPKKMACGAWSLPFGPPRYGGTCLHSSIVDEIRRLVSDPRRFICAGCYAGEGQYTFMNQQLIRIIRRVWLEQALSEGTFADSFLHAFAAWRSRRRASSDGVEANHDWFRIHDSGDVAWGGEEYIAAWMHIARKVPEVTFWMPTRDWVDPAVVKQFAKRPRNLVVRPSSLCAYDDPPRVRGLDGGTTIIIDKKHIKALGLHVSIACPAYLEGEHATCESVRCRRCWTLPKKSVAYKIHASTRLRQAAEEFLAKKNPAHVDARYVAAQYALGMDITDLIELQG